MTKVRIIYLTYPLKKTKDLERRDRPELPHVWLLPSNANQRLESLERIIEQRRQSDGELDAVPLDRQEAQPELVVLP